MIKALLTALVAAQLTTSFPVIPTNLTSKVYQPDEGRVGIILTLSYEQAQKDNVKMVCEGISTTFKGIQSNDPYEWDAYMCMSPDFKENFDADNGLNTVTAIWMAPNVGTTVWGKAVVIVADKADAEKAAAEVTTITSVIIK